MDTVLTDYILAIITLDGSKVQGGGCPVFIAGTQQEQEKLSLFLSRILDGIVHDLENGVFLICKH